MMSRHDPDERVELESPGALAQEKMENRLAEIPSAEPDEFDLALIKQAFDDSNSDLVSLEQLKERLQISPDGHGPACCSPAKAWKCSRRGGNGVAKLIKDYGIATCVEAAPANEEAALEWSSWRQDFVGLGRVVKPPREREEKSGRTIPLFLWWE